jgi:hypothetical protein
MALLNDPVTLQHLHRELLQGGRRDHRLADISPVARHR